MKLGLIVAAILMVISCTKKLEPGAVPGSTGAEGSTTPGAPGAPAANNAPGEIQESPVNPPQGPYKNIEEFKADRRKKVQEAIDLQYKTTEEQLKDPQFKSQNILMQKRAEKAKEAQEYVEKLREKER